MAYKPDWSVAPGEILLETLEKREISQTELARRSGWSLKHINQVVRGKANITTIFAIMLEDQLGKPSAEFWMNLQARWEIFSVRGRRRGTRS